MTSRLGPVRPRDPDREGAGRAGSGLQPPGRPGWAQPAGRRPAGTRATAWRLDHLLACASLALREQRADSSSVVATQATAAPTRCSSRPPPANCLPRPNGPRMCTTPTSWRDSATTSAASSSNCSSASPNKPSSPHTSTRSCEDNAAPVHATLDRRCTVFGALRAAESVAATGRATSSSRSDENRGRSSNRRPAEGSVYETRRCPDAVSARRLCSAVCGRLRTRATRRRKRLARR